MRKTPWASIAKIEADGVHSGTGFLVTGHHVLTARHVVADETGRPFSRIRLRFFVGAEYEGEPEFETSATIVDGFSSAKDDFALLLCGSSPPPLSQPLLLGERCGQFLGCVSPGFAIQDPAGFTASGKISSLNEPVENGGTAIGLQFDFGSGVLMKGHSGAPVLIYGRVVGLLRTAFLDEKKRTMGGMVQATSIARVVDYCNQRSPDLLAFHSPITWPRPASTQDTRILADRRGEFEIFERMITGQCRERILLLKGASDCGKTVLADELMEYARRLGLPVAKADCKGCPSMDFIFRCFLFGLGRGVLPVAAAEAGDSRFFSMMDDLTALEHAAVIAFDTWQVSSQDVRDWMEKVFLPNLWRMPGVVVLIGGQEVPDRRAPAWGDLAVLRPLEPIRSAEDWFEYCLRRWPSSTIVKQHVEAITLTASANATPGVIAAALETLHGGLQLRVAPVSSP